VFPRFKPTVLATEPLKDPVKVREPLVAVSEAKSLLKPDSAIDDVATVFTFPFELAYKNPCERDDRYTGAEKVDEAVENIPPVKPITDDVALPHVKEVKGKVPLPPVAA